ncbi:MAG: hypothetical protein LPJ89_11185 [Hymenobacteraceae bacterium]|nr:hypothetical protein [Hymenobacteraceae bacterium]MDX5396877.1 hypothetical protein [Hymenobacteraceae bacterium]MDX5444331.1 hypothetical protein [Hymenobacteraceae bacterium]MDX5512948.1 hypothetical protein [Hymenobacteraceae bacterium]
MKSVFKPFYIVAALVAVFLTSCGDEDDTPPPANEEELITSVTLRLVNTADANDVVTASFRDPDGDGGNAPIQFDSLIMKPNTTYAMTVALLDESKNPVVDISEEVKEEGDEHELFFVPSSGLNVTITKTDRDANNLPIGLTGTVATGAASSGTLRVVLKHQPNLKSATSDITVGDTDVEVDFKTAIR